MDLTRRAWLGLLSTAGAVALISPLWAAARATASVITPGKSGRDYGPAMAHVRTFAASDLAEKGFPGMSLALLGGDGFSAALSVGLADLERRVPVSPDQLFQIGSIAKSLVAMCLFVLADQGKLDLDARVQPLLPEHPLPPEPITIAQLLEHSSGLPSSAEAFPDVPGGRLWTGFTPGLRHSYCNLGYDLLGDIIERVTGMTLARALETMVLRPLGMMSAEALIRTADRSRYATGYRRVRDDLAWLPGAPLAPAQWVDWDDAAGSVAATPSDMARYMAFVVRLSRGKGAPLFSDRLAERFRTKGIEASEYGPEGRYSNGLVSFDAGGTRLVGHTGGMLAFSSTFLVDPEAGVGCFASVNVGGAGGYRPREVVEYACAVLKAASSGTPLPEVRQPKKPSPVKDAARFTGRWLSQDAGEFSIHERAGDLFITRAGGERPLRSVAATGFVTDDPSLPASRLNFVDGPQPLLIVGGSLFGRDSPPPKPAASPRLARLAGRYYSAAAWEPWFNVFAVGDKLLIGAGPLVEAPDGSWRLPNNTERAWFQNMVDGRPQQLNVSGVHFRRVHDRRL